MALKLFGIEIISDKQVPNTPITMDTVTTDSSVDINTDPNMSGFVSNVNGISIDIATQEENKLITEYRNLLTIPEVDMCVEEIVQEAIIYPKDGGKAVDIDLSNLDEKFYTEKIKKLIKKEFDTVYDLLMFNSKGHDIFKRWLVDSRVNYYKNVDFQSLTDGIQSLQFIDPRKIKKVTESNKLIDKNSQRLIVNNYKEYFYYNDNPDSDKKNNTNMNNPNFGIGMMTKSIVSTGMLTRDSVAYCPSGITDASGKMVIGYLFKALKVANNLKLMEDSMLIYKLSRAPERRIFYIDTGNLPKAKAEQYVKEIADKYKTKTAYDINTGKIRNDRAFLALTEDFWLARGGGSTGTSIDTLPGGQNSGDTSEVDYFKNKLYDALGVPSSRFEDPPPMFSPGTMITRDEVRFSRLIERLRMKFNVLFLEILGTQLVLKNIINQDNWETIKNKLVFVYAEDNYFKEQIKSERLSQAANYLQVYDAYVGKYFSRNYFYKNVANLSEDDIQKIEEEMKEEKAKDLNMQLTELNLQMQILQLQQQIKALQNPQPDMLNGQGEAPNAQNQQ